MHDSAHADHRSDRRSRHDAVRRGGGDRPVPPGTVMYFRERMYAAFTGLAIVRAVDAGHHADPKHAFLTLLLGVVGIVIAGTLSEIVAHLLVHRTLAHGDEWRVMASAAGGALATAVVPVLLIGAGWIGWMPVDVALKIAAVLYILTLAGIGWLAVRRSTLTGGQKAIVLAALVGLGVLVVAVQQLAKSV